jgi:hypothetical protein
MGRTIMNRRTLTTIALLGLAVATALPHAGFAQSNPWIGTWKTNVAKSTYSPGPPPRSQTVTYRAEGQGLRLTVEGVDAQGNPAKLDFGVIFDDGKSHPLSGVPNFDAQSFKVVNDSTAWTIRTKAGKVVQTLTSVLSADGETETMTFTAVNTNGQQVNNVVVREKQ